MSRPRGGLRSVHQRQASFGPRSGSPRQPVKHESERRHSEASPYSSTGSPSTSMSSRKGSSSSGGRRTYKKKGGGGVERTPESARNDGAEAASTTGPWIAQIQARYTVRRAQARIAVGCGGEERPERRLLAFDRPLGCHVALQDSAPALAAELLPSESPVSAGRADFCVDSRQSECRPRTRTARDALGTHQVPEESVHTEGELR